MRAETPINTFTPNVTNQRLLRDALGRFCTGVVIVTASTTDGPAAITVNSFSSVSLTPALVLWSISRDCSRYKAFTQAEHYSIHVLTHDQESLCMSVARNPNHIENIPTTRNGFGVPVFDCLVRFDCALHARYDAGDHDIILGAIKLATMPEHSAPLAFFGGATTTVSQHRSA